MREQSEKQLKDGELYERLYRYKERGSTLRFYCILALLVLAALTFRIWWVSSFACVEVDGGSMKPTLVDGERLLMRYGQDADYGDIIVVDVRKYVKAYDKHDPLYRDMKPFAAGTQLLIKRLIAKEGDTVYAESGKLFIRYKGGTEFVEYEHEPEYISKIYSYGFSEYTVGEGEIFFLGDNREGSLDDRFHEADGRNSHINGLYKVSDIYGVVSDWAYENRKGIEYVFKVQDFFRDTYEKLRKLFT
ncbi:MAG: signal peptidase I [Clostridia bacterium]|nr:signal peptidase I [Clostridia bacterium]